MTSKSLQGVHLMARPKPLSYNMIEMYVETISSDFNRLEQCVQDKIEKLKPLVIARVRIKLKIDHLYEEADFLNERLEEIKFQLIKFQSPYKCYPSYVKSAIDREIDSLLKPLHHQIQEIRYAREQLCRRIKLSGIAPEIEGVFVDLPEILKDLEDRLVKIPSPTIEELEMLQEDSCK